VLDAAMATPSSRPRDLRSAGPDGGGVSFMACSPLAPGGPNGPGERT
jgi:hypothetical protein